MVKSKAVGLVNEGIGMSGSCIGSAQFRFLTNFRSPIVSRQIDRYWVLGVRNYKFISREWKVRFACGLLPLVRLSSCSKSCNFKKFSMNRWFLANFRSPMFHVKSIDIGYWGAVTNLFIENGRSDFHAVFCVLYVCSAPGSPASYKILVASFELGWIFEFECRLRMRM